MLVWALSAIAGVALALFSYRGRIAPPVVLRALALTLVIALAAGAPARPPRPPAPLVALDVSSSMRRGGDSALWRAALARVKALAPDTLWLFGDSSRAGSALAVPSDALTRALGVVDRARAAGRPVVLISDGEVDDAAQLGALPAGSRVELIARAPLRDAAVTEIEAPSRAVAGDTIAMRITVRTAAGAVPHAVLSVRAGSRLLVDAVVDSMGADAERVIAVRVAVPTVPGAALLTASIAAPGDAEARNDSASVTLEVARAEGAVFVSSAPDEEIRYLVPVLRGALALPARGFYRVAPGAWRREGTLAPVPESEVRAALRAAPLAIVHGDTAILGAPRVAASGALLLMPEGNPVPGEWYVSAAPASPVAAALAGVPWDSVPPLAVPDVAPDGEWVALAVARARRYDPRAAIAGSDRSRRVVIAAAMGSWRWKFRGGASAAAYDALWGGIVDWLAAERRDPRAAAPVSGLLRAGEPVRWRRGGSTRSPEVTVVAKRRGATRADTLVLHFAPDAIFAESAPMEPGVYDLTVPGGAAVLAVNASREWLPRTSVLLAGTTVPGDSPLHGDAPPLRDRGWPYLLAIAALCSEWILRRRAGLR